MRKTLASIAIGLSLALGACSNSNAVGPTYPGIGTVDQKQMEKNADAARLTYFALINLAAQYTDLPRCTATQKQPCSSQAAVDEIRRVRQVAGTATKGAVDIATSPTKSPIALANAVNDAQRAVAVFRSAVAKVNPEANKVQ